MWYFYSYILVVSLRWLARNILQGSSTGQVSSTGIACTYLQQLLNSILKLVHVENCLPVVVFFKLFVHLVLCGVCRTSHGW